VSGEACGCAPRPPAGRIRWRPRDRDLPLWILDYSVVALIVTAVCAQWPLTDVRRRLRNGDRRRPWSGTDWMESSSSQHSPAKWSPVGCARLNEAATVQRATTLPTEFTF